MLVVANTPFEAALASAQAAGAVTSGNSAGAAVESADMIAGFTGSNGPEQGLEEDSVDVWTYDSLPTDTDARPDLRPPGRPARPARLPARPDRAPDQRIVHGRRARPWRRRQHGGDDRGWHQPDQDRRGHGRVRGRFADLRRDRPLRPVRARCRSTTSRPRSCRPAMATTWPHASRSWAAIAVPAPDITGRAFPSLATPAGSGPLLLAGGSPSASVLDRLVAASGGTGSKIVVIAAGYAKPRARDEGRQGLRGVA